MDLVKDKIYLDKKIGTESSQFLVEGDIIVPDIKPDMSSILQTHANIITDKIELLHDKLNFIGRLDLNLFYIAKDSDNPIFCINNSIAIDEFINIDGADSEMFTDVKVSINKIDYKMLNDRKINFRAVIDIIANVVQESEYEIVSAIKNIPSSQLLKENLTVNRLIENRSDRFIVKDELNIPSGKPNIREILQTDIDIVSRDIKSGNGKITVNGELLLKTLYKSDSSENIIEIVEHELPFNGVFDVPKAKDFMLADVKLFVQDKYIHIKPNEDGEDRVLDTEIFIGANIKINSQEDFEILSDAYCIDEKLEIIRETVSYSNIICRNKMQSPIKEIIQLDENCPDILQILKINAAVNIDDSHIINDKAMVEGIIDIDILYIAKSDESPIYSYKTVLPYRQTLEVRGALPEMEMNIDTTIEHIGFNMLSNDEIDLRILLGFNAEVIKQQQSKIITDIKFSEIDKEILENMPSMVVYIVQNGDRLWDIAKRYNMSIDELKDVNEIEDDVQVGQKLLILKNVTV